MSMEAALAENTKALNALNETNSKLVVNQERLLAGQKEAIEKIEAGKGGKAAAPKIDAPKPAPAKTEPAPPAGVSNDDVKNAAVAWMTALTKGKSDADAKPIKQECGKFLNEILAHFGTGGKLTGTESKLDAEQFKQAKFFIDRKAAGLSVDLSADYDFDGDPKQGAEEADPLG